MRHTIPLTAHITLDLVTTQPWAEPFLTELLAGWPPSDLFRTADNHDKVDTAVSIPFTLTQTDALPPLPPDLPPIFQDKNDDLLDVYQPTAEQFLLHFPDGALVQIDLAAQTVQGSFTSAVLHNSRLEDVIFTSLAPLLRRHGCYLVHAFAAVCSEAATPAAVLVVGPTRSGKTTTGLQLVLSGWRLLANDVVLLQATAEGEIYAHPWPGLITVRPYTFELLPQLAEHIGSPAFRPTENVTLTSEQIAGDKWGTAVPVRTIYFPHIQKNKSHSKLVPQKRALALATLLQESLDRWDTEQIAPHSQLLHQLVNQAATYKLQLGQAVAQLPELLMVDS